MFSKGYRIRNYDFKLVLLILALSTIGVFAVGSAQPSVQQRQLLGVITGAFLMIVISLLDYTVLIKLYWLMYLGNLVLLLLVRFFGEETKGAQRWFQIPGGFRFQPSETAKILLILFFAQFIMKHIEKFNTFRIITVCIALMAVPWYLIYKQPDLSTSIVMIALFCIIMFAGGLNFKVIFAVLAVAVPALALLVALALQPDSIVSNVLTGNQLNRILAFVYPDQYATTTAYQQLNSVTAIASGMLNGKGYMNNEITSVKNGNFISEAQTDFIFAVIGEEFGFKGSLAVILLEMLIALECIHVARKARDPAGMIIAAGMGGLVGVQAFINIGVATFILPTTGLTLPFVSYGLTSLMSLFIGMGFVLNVRLQTEDKSDKLYGRVFFMNIALIAHDAKKKLMQNFCIAYRGILNKNELYATGTTGRLIEEVTNLNIHKFLAGHLGGEQQIGAQIEHNQMDLVIFLRDPLTPKSHEPDVNNVVKLCDMHNIPLATNLATAELLIKSLDRGDLEWREMYK